MTSNFKRTLQAALAVVVVVGSVATARAQEETPPPPPAAAPGPTSGPPGSFGESGQWLLSVEHIFGYTYAHQSNNVSANTFTVLGDSAGAQKSMYDWPRLSLDAMLTKSVSLGLALSFVRLSATAGNSHISNTGYEGALRAGYAMMASPWLGIWPRAGVTYAHETNQSAFAITLEGLVVAAAAPHVLITFGPVADIGVYGKINTANVTFLNIGAYFGLTMPF